MRGWLVACLLAACGRYDFVPLDATDGSHDGGGCGHTFCDNFDRVGAPGDGWSSTHQANGGALMLATDASVSNPGSLHVSLATTGDEGFLVERLGAATTHLHASFAFEYAAATGTNVELDLVQFLWDATSLAPACLPFGFFFVRDGSKSFALQESTTPACGGNRTDLIANYDNTPFHTVDFDLTFGAPGRITVSIDGQAPVLDNLATLYAVPPLTDMTMQLGASADRNVPPAWDIHYDDVIVDVQ